MQGDALQSIWNIDQQIADGATLEALLTKSKAQLIEYNTTILSYKSSAGDKSATTALVQANQQMIDSQAKLTAALERSTNARKGIRSEAEAGLVAAKKEAVATDDAGNAWKRFSASVRDAQARAAGMNLTLGEGHPLAIQANADAIEMANRQKLLSGAVGDTRTNVGNYHGSLITLSKGIKGLGGLGIILSRALGIDPETAMAVREAGRAIRDLSHIKELDKVVQQGTTIATNENNIATNTSTITTIANTGAVEAQTVAIEEEVVAVEAEAVARTGLTAIMWGAIAAGLALVGVIVYLIFNHKSELELLKESVKAQKEYSDSITDLTETIELKNKIANDDLELQKKKLEADLAVRTALGITSGQELAFKKQINEIDRKIIDQRLKSLPESKRDLDEQTNALKLQTDLLLTQQEATKNLIKLKNSGTKEIKTGTETIQLAEGGSYDSPITEKTSDLIDKSKKYADVLKEGVESTRKTVETLQKIKSDGLDQDKKDREVAAAQAKLSADEIRRYTLASAEIEVESEQSKNNRILSNDHSTFAQRFQAMKDNQIATEKLLKFQNASVQSDPTISGNDKVIFTMKMNEKLDELRKDEAAKELKAIEDNNKRILAAQHAASASNIDATAAALQVVTKDITIALDTRLQAYTDYYAKEHEKIIADHDFQSATKELNSAELIALDIETNNKLKALKEKSVGEISGIIVSSLNNDLSLQESFDKKELASRILNISKTVHNKKEQQKQISQAEFEASEDRLTNEIQNDAKMVADSNLSNEARIAAEKDMNDKLADLDTLRTKHTQDEQEKKKAKEKEVQDYIVKITESTIDLITTLVDAGYQKQLDAIQALTDANNDYATAETNRINNSTLNEQDKAAAIIELNAKVATNNKIYAEQERQVKIKQAKFDKAAGEAKIIINTAVQISEHLGNPFAIALIAALGAIELAIAIATPLPAYKDGGTVAKDGTILAGEAGRELMIGPDGSVSLTPNKATLLQAKAGTKIIPHDETMRRLAAGMIVGNAMQAEVKDTAVQDAIMKAAGMTVKAIERNNRKTVNKIIIDPRYAAYIGQQVYGKS